MAEGEEGRGKSVIEKSAVWYVMIVLFLLYLIIEKSINVVFSFTNR